MLCRNALTATSVRRFPEPSCDGSKSNTIGYGVSKDRRSASFETKNYDINTNSDGLVGKVVEQVLDRVQHLPPGMQQNIRIDARGQQVTEGQLNDVARRIVERSNGLLKPENIEFRRVR